MAHTARWRLPRFLDACRSSEDCSPERCEHHWPGYHLCRHHRSGYHVCGITMQVIVCAGITVKVIPTCMSARVSAQTEPLEPLLLVAVFFAHVKYLDVVISLGCTRVS